jgi:hypothetical protein
MIRAGSIARPSEKSEKASGVGPTILVAMCFEGRLFGEEFVPIQPRLSDAIPLFPGNSPSLPGICIFMMATVKVYTGGGAL